MNTSNKPRPEDAGAFGRLLRFWRGTVGISQEELAARTGVSARHISFLENGRSRPGRTMVGDLATELRLPVTDRDTLLAAAGFMPGRVAVNLHDEHFGWLRKSLVVSLRGMDPFAASAFDNYGNVHMVNRGWLALHRLLLPDTQLLPPLNSYHLYFSEQGLRPLLVDWEEVACRLLMTLQQEVLLSGDGEAERLLEELLRYPSIPGDWQRRAAGIEHQHSFRVRLQLAADQQLSLLNVVYTAGDTPHVSEPRVLVSLLIPEDPQLPGGIAEACEAWQAPHPLLFY